MWRSKRRRHPWKWLALTLAALAAGPLLYAVYLRASLTLPSGEERRPIRLYSAPYSLRPGASLEEARLEARLRHLEYRLVRGKLTTPGDFRPTPDGYEVYLHEFLYPDGWHPAKRIHLVVEEGRIKRILGADDRELGPTSLEPELIGGVLAASRQVRDWTPLSAIPPRLIDAVLTVEDRRFYSHSGIDFIGVLRAAWHNVQAGEVVEGGSTITQQLAKNLFYTPQRTFVRKLQEALAAIVLERKYSKHQILESYLNEIYFGQSGSVAVYGVSEAAHLYFGKPVQNLTLPESALLAGMIKAPNAYDPFKDPERARKRRDLVLTRLHQSAKITSTAYEAAMNSAVIPASPTHHAADAPYFVDYLLSQFDEPLRAHAPHALRLHTTLDPEWQRLAEDAVRLATADLEARYAFLREHGDRLQAALVAINAKTGAILAMVGGRDYRTGQFNHAVQARRQAGSLFKPFVYLAAFERGVVDPKDAITPLTRLSDQPVSYASGTVRWEPRNFDRKFRGEVTVRTALEQSLNVPAVRLAQEVGVKKIIALLQHAGIQGSLEENLGLALGTSDVSLLEITGAFSVLANEGRFAAPTAFTALMQQSGERSADLIEIRKSDSIPVVSPQAAYLVTDLLKGAVAHGTAASAHALGLVGTVAGKTGTTDDHRDAWFVGYTPDVVVGVWVGFDEGATLRLTGAQAALPVWVRFVSQIVTVPSPEFPLPAAVVTRSVDPQTGLLATDGCPERRTEVFLEGTEPTQYCDVHAPGLFERLRRLFQS